MSDKQRSGRPVNAVTDVNRRVNGLIRADRRATIQELCAHYMQTFKKLKEAIRKKRLDNPLDSVVTP